MYELVRMIAGSLALGWLIEHDGEPPTESKTYIRSSDLPEGEQHLIPDGLTIEVRLKMVGEDTLPVFAEKEFIRGPNYNRIDYPELNETDTAIQIGELDFFPSNYP